MRRFLWVQRTAARNGRGRRNVWVEVEGDQVVTRSAANQQTYTQALWWTSENVQLTTGGTATPSAVVGTSYVIQVGVQGLNAQDGSSTPVLIENVQAWVCFPNTVAGHASVWRANAAEASR